jgi:hypothetical protein
MCVSALRPTSQHVIDQGDHPTQLGIATPAFDAGLDVAPQPAALAPLLAIAVPHHVSAAVDTATTERVAVATFVSSQLARGPPV